MWTTPLRHNRDPALMTAALVILETRACFIPCHSPGWPAGGSSYLLFSVGISTDSAGSSFGCSDVSGDPLSYIWLFMKAGLCVHTTLHIYLSAITYRMSAYLIVRSMPSLVLSQNNSLNRLVISVCYMGEKCWETTTKSWLSSKMLTMQECF